MPTTLPKRIAFLSYYGHQRRFFAAVAAGLPAGIAAEPLGIYPLSVTTEFGLRLTAALAKPTLDRDRCDRIVAFARRKFAARHPDAGPLRQVFVERLQRARAEAYYGLFKRRLARFDLVVVWNGLPLPVAAAAAAANDLGIPVLFCENGVLPKTVAMDPCGVNAKSLLANKGADFYRALEPDREKLATLLHTRLIARPLNARTAARPQAETFELPEEFVFLPLQVHDDSQILMYSPRFSDMPTVVDFVAGGLDAFNATHGTDTKLVVKEHPSDYGRIDYSTLRARHPDAVFTRLHDTADLIARARAVVTVNSTVGIEALLAMKPVVTLGKAFYNVPGLVRPCRDDRFETALAEALATLPDRDLIEKFLYRLYYDYLVAFDRRDLAHADPTAAGERIVRVLDGRFGLD